VVTREEGGALPSDTHVNFDANVNTTVNKLGILGDSPPEKNRLYIENDSAQRDYSFMGEPEFAMQPFRQTAFGASSAAANAGLSDSEKEKSERIRSLAYVRAIFRALFCWRGFCSDCRICDVHGFAHVRLRFRHYPNQPTDHNTPSSISE